KEMGNVIWIDYPRFGPRSDVHECLPKIRPVPNCVPLSRPVMQRKTRWPRDHVRICGVGVQTTEDGLNARRGPCGEVQLSRPVTKGTSGQQVLLDGIPSETTGPEMLERAIRIGLIVVEIESCAAKVTRATPLHRPRPAGVSQPGGDPSLRHIDGG